MNTKLFGAISLEEAALGNAESITIETVMSIEDLETDVIIAAEAVNSDLQMIDSALEVADAMDTQIAVESAILAAGEVPVGVAQMAAVSLQNNATMLGMDISTVAISAESIEQSPTTALKVALEEKESTFKLIIKKIKEMFSKLWSNIKKLAAKALAFVSGYEKKFNALAKAAAELGELKKDAKISDGENKKIANKFYFTMAGEKKIKVSTITADVAKVGINADSLTKDMKAIIEATKKNGKLTKATNDTIKDLSLHYKVNENDVTGTGRNCAMARIDGTTVKMVVFSKADDGKSLTCNYMTIPADKDKLKKVVELKNDILSKDDIKSLINVGKSKATTELKDIDKSNESTLKEIDAAIKGSKETEDKEADAARARALNSISVNVLKFTSDTMLGHLAVMKNISYLASLNMSKYEKKK